MFSAALSVGVPLSAREHASNPKRKEDTISFAHSKSYVFSPADEKTNEEWCLLGCYAVWFLQEPHG
jgi:hypothetical protein